MTSLDFAAAPNEHLGLAIAENRLFKTQDGGENWQELSVSLAGRDPRGITAVRFDRFDPTRAYLYDSQLGRGYLSTDGALTWAAGGRAEYVSDDQLLASLENPLHLLLSDGQDVYRSTDGGATLRAKGPSCTLACNKSLAWPGALSAPAWALTIEYPLAAPDEVRLFRSDDFADSWTEVTAPPNTGYPLIAPSPSSASVLYSTNSGQNYPVKPHTSTNSGQSWAALPEFQKSDAIQGLFALPGVQGDVLFATFLINSSGLSYSELVWRYDGNGPWQKVADLSLREVTGMTTGPSGWVAQTDRGLYGSDDEGLTWTPLGLGINSSASAPIAVSNEPAPKVLTAVSCRREHISSSTDGGRTFTDGPETYLGYLPKVAIHPADASFWTLNANGLHVSEDAGATWTPAHGGRVGMAFDPDNADVLFVASETELLRSTDRGANWTPVFSTPYFNIASFAAGRSTSDYLFLGESVLWVSTDSGSSWQERALPITPGRIAFVEQPQPSLFSLTGSNRDNYFSSDLGQTWTRVTSLPNGVKSDPIYDRSSGELLIGTEDGLFSSPDGLDWQPNGELSGVSVRSLDQNRYGHTVAGTWRYGVFFDNDPVFFGDFETGDLSHWSQTTP